jgi:hypothetical protein
MFVFLILYKLSGEEKLPHQYLPRNHGGIFTGIHQSGVGTSGGGRRSDEPVGASGGGGLLQSVGQAGTSLLRAAMSLVPTIRFKPWPLNNRSSTDSSWPTGKLQERRRRPENSLPDNGRPEEWRPLAV